MANCLEVQFKPNETDDQFLDHHEQVIRGVQRFRYTIFESCVESKSSNEMKNVIKNFKSNNGPGHDGVTNSMLKKLHCHFANHLVAIYNCVLKLQHFPACWKKQMWSQIPSRGRTICFLRAENLSVFSTVWGRSTTKLYWTE